MDDAELLRDFVRGNSDEAFAALVSRHVNLVYSVALRRTSNPHAADEITQAVFVILARKAKSLGPKTVLSGWLYQTARLTAANYLRAELRRARREQEAYMQSISTETGSELWPQIAPLLEDAIGRLGEKDRSAVVLRFFDGKNLEEVGQALGVSADAAKMRVNRAVEKLRLFFAKHGVTASASTIEGAVSANSTQAAPLGVSAASLAAAKGTVTTGTSLALAKSGLQTLAWMRFKATATVALGVLLVAGTVTLVASQTARERLFLASNGWPGPPPLIVPLKSVGPIRADMTTPQVIAVLGEPDKRTGNFLHYVRFGFSVISHPGKETLRAVFCGNSWGQENALTKAFKGRTGAGIGMGSTRAELIAAYGEPTEIHPGNANETLMYQQLDMSFTLARGKVVYLVVNF
jgi:RNA polymerase sigma factor (sigma-70 family)